MYTCSVVYVFYALCVHNVGTCDVCVVCVYARVVCVVF